MNSLSLAEIRRKAKNPENIWFSVFYTCSSLFVWVAARVGLSPNQVTLAAFFVNCCSAFYFLASDAASSHVLIAAIGFVIAHVLDCADGHLAFVTDQRSERGYWLDSALDVYKIAFLTLCFMKLVTSLSTLEDVTLPSKNMVLCASMGMFINYAVSLHASKYKVRIDPYEGNTFEATGVSAVRFRVVRMCLSHVREYGNFLVIFTGFAFDARVASLALAGLGICHYALGAHRIFRVSKIVGSTGA